MHNKKVEKDAKDPVCGMEVNEKTARHKVKHMKTYYFFCSMCQGKFEAGPHKYMKM